MIAFQVSLNLNPVKEILKKSMLDLVSGKLLPEKLPSIKFPPGKFSPMFLNIPTHVFNFFVFSLLSPLSLILLKRLFRDSFSKVVKLDLLQCIKKFCSLPAVYLSKELKVVVESWIIV